MVAKRNQCGEAPMPISMQILCYKPITCILITNMEVR